MPPHLHPRSRMTSSLFASTVVACFFVVTLPHILPCPVPAKRFADGEVVVDENGRRRRYRRKETPEEASSGIIQFGSGIEGLEGNRDARRECPVPKPGGILGEWLGFHKEEAEQSRSRPDR
jgi:cytochrome c oxidase assembly factor 2